MLSACDQSACVCSIRTSDLKAMAYGILKISQPSFATQPKHTSGSAEIVQAGRNRVIQGPRPCVVLKPASSRTTSCSGKRESQLDVCLMGTFTDEDFSNLPEILKFFAIPVYPHFLVDGSVNGLNITPHIHTSPEWARTNTWILAYKYMIERSHISGLWVHNGDNDDDVQRGITYCLDEQQLSALLALCNERSEAWDLRVQSDPDFVQRCLQELEAGRCSRSATESPTKHYPRARSRSPVRTKEGNAAGTVVRTPPKMSTRAAHPSQQTLEPTSSVSALQHHNAPADSGSFAYPTVRFDESPTVAANTNVSGLEYDQVEDRTVWEGCPVTGSLGTAMLLLAPSRSRATDSVLAFLAYM
ncbi:hypothetical protein C8Q78DRAFT_1094460 [Trametes maxima]|nr:hypothetical protein C8Q78DRAFT_1094460 [Trametes maxima]